MATELVGSEEEVRPRRWLCGCDDGSAFGYARGHDFIRRSDHRLWAHLSERWLISSRSGAPLAYQVGNTFYDVSTNAPIYFQPELSPGLFRCSPEAGENCAVRVTRVGEPAPHCAHIADLVPWKPHSRRSHGRAARLSRQPTPGGVPIRGSWDGALPGLMRVGTVWPYACESRGCGVQPACVTGDFDTAPDISILADAIPYEVDQILKLAH